MMRMSALIVCAAATTASVGAAPGEAGLAARAHRAAGCAIKREREATRQLARAMPGSEREAQAYGALGATVRRCFEAHKLADTAEARALFAGAAAQRLYVGTTSYYHAGETRDAPAITVPAAAVEAWNRKREAAPPEARALECAIGKAGNQVDALIRSAPGSARERNTMAAVTAALAACLDRGQQLRMSPRQFRAAMTRAFFRHLDGIPFGP